jgi:hypothetical protein
MVLLDTVQCLEYLSVRLLIDGESSNNSSSLNNLQRTTYN